jgi:hypothetical protein
LQLATPRQGGRFHDVHRSDVVRDRRTAIYTAESSTKPDFCASSRRSRQSVKRGGLRIAIAKPGPG